MLVNKYALRAVQRDFFTFISYVIYDSDKVFIAVEYNNSIVSGVKNVNIIFLVNKRSFGVFERTDFG